jgi:hypothetical protein
MSRARRIFDFIFRESNVPEINDVLKFYKQRQQTLLLECFTYVNTYRTDTIIQMRV